jgi:MoaA/NifB/PqqE/SkfB family radical SAM enzyme
MNVTSSLDRLVGLLAGRGVSDVYLQAGRPPIVKREGKLAVVGALKPVSGDQVKRLASELMDDRQRLAFEGRDEVDFSAKWRGETKLRVRLSQSAGRPTLSIRDLSGAAKHVSLEKPPVKRHWVRLTRVCNDKCSFCLDWDAQNGTSLPMSAILSDLKKGRDMGLTRVVLSGGEPTVHPDFIEIVRRTRELGYTHIQTVTNGRRMCYKDFLLASVEAGLSEVTFSLHGHTPELHDSQTGSPGSFVQGVLALRQALKVPGLIVSVDTVISKQNVRHLRDILDFFIRQGVREFDLLQVIPFGSAWRNKDILFYDVEAELPHLHRALDLSKRGDIVIWTNRLPTQYLEGYEDLIQPPGKLHDEYKGRGLMFVNFLRLGMKPDCWGRCPHCFLQKPCADIAKLHEEGRLDAYPVPKCLEDHAEFLLEPASAAPARLEHSPNLEMKSFVEFYIRGRYFLKGTACKTCRYDGECAGAPVEHVRRYGFPKPKPEMIAKAAAG